MDRQEVTEYEVTDADGQREVRIASSGRELYPAEDWARDHAALGHRARRRRIVVLEGWTDLPVPRDR